MLITNKFAKSRRYVHDMMHLIDVARSLSVIAKMEFVACDGVAKFAERTTKTHIF